MVELHVAQESTSTAGADPVVQASSLPTTSTLEWAAQLVSAWRGAGHTCVPLAELSPIGIATALRASPVVGTVGEFKPLILDTADRLYLHRYWAYERTVSESIIARSRNPPIFDAELLEQGLARFFPEHSEQREAAARTVQSSFSVITGGPGTGKTRTVVILLALLIEQFAAQGRKPRIALAAPTGKASARLKESLRITGARLQLPENIRASLPAEATTLHRLLGATPHSPYFRHDADRPLAVDAVIVDEASMVDLALMAKLFDAVPATARLILLGDKDQLASVEAGYVLGDICRAGETHDSPLAGHITELRTNYRFGSGSGIHALSAAVNSGRSQEALERLSAGAAEVSSALLPVPSALASALRTRILEGYGPYLADAPDPATALARLQDFRILAALRRGPFGIENLNRLTEGLLAVPS